jgi:hypothetical protein
MRLEVEQPDHVRGGEFLCRQGQLLLGIAVIPDYRKAASPESIRPVPGLWIPGSSLRSAPE